ncbi:aspartate/glutamate racemase family protein [Candidatus Ishikawella capsulata]|nr:aspartate/glutamate racemase family protein [Candidatus Ishikawaella capsulata]
MHLIQVINPNTSVNITNVIQKAACAVAFAGTKIIAVSPCQGISSIEGHFDEAIATMCVLEQIKQGKERGVHGHIIACFGDPGLLAAREFADGPVIGIAEAAMHIASLIATRFSIITTLPRTFNIIRNLLQRYGFISQCVALHAINMPVLSLEDDSVYQKVYELCLKVKQKDGSGAIVLGCSGMANLASKLTKVLGVPVIDGVSSAVKLVESVLSLGISTSKHGDLAYPLPKKITGYFEALN